MLTAVGFAPQQSWPLSQAPPPSRYSTRWRDCGCTLTAMPVGEPFAQRESGKSIQVHSSASAPRAPSGERVTTGTVGRPAALKVGVEVEANAELPATTT